MDLRQFQFWSDEMANQDHLQRDLHSNTGKINENINEMYAYRRLFLSLGVLTKLKMLYLYFWKTVFNHISVSQPPLTPFQVL